MSSLALSVLLSLVSAVAYATAAVVQERVAEGVPGGRYAPVRSGAWWAAVGLNGAGGLLHVAALAYGPLSLVQPLGTLTLVIALPLAALPVRGGAGSGGPRGGAGPGTWVGAVLATAGLAWLPALTETTGAGAPDGAERAVLSGVSAAVIGSLFLLAHRARRPGTRAVALAAGAGVSFGVASVFTKIVAEESADGTWGGLLPGLLPELLMIAGPAVAGMLLSQASYRGAGLAAPLATVTVVNPVVAAAVGVALFGERFRHGAAGTAAALVCAAAAACGLLLLIAGRRRAADSVPEHGPYAEPVTDPGGEPVTDPGGEPAPGHGTALVTARDTALVSDSDGPRAAGRAPLPRPGGDGAASDADAARTEVPERIDVGPVPRPRAHLEVEMRSGAVAGGP
ncbi:DMT family transporter [Streptomyces sp. NPDC058434]|uniref:DMT family transporter n=1 Tax=Streptomyces sp. NPDC058434 TaxID=3346498 RepID=UPI00364EBBC9